MAGPRVSILFPVHNGERYLRGALDSVLAQTMPDFEVELLNDGSTDGTAAIVRDYRDARIRYREQANAGLSASLNRLVQEARGQYVARMDHDDWSRSDRLERQAGYLDTHPRTVLVGSWAEIMDEHGRVVSPLRFPVTAAGIREAMLFINPIVHGSVMARRVPELEYRAEFDDAEDLDLWERLARSHELANLPLPLYRWRSNPAGISRLRRGRQSERAAQVTRRWRDWYIPRASELASSRDDLTAEAAAMGAGAVVKRKLRMMGLFASRGAVGACARAVPDLMRALVGA